MSEQEIENRVFLHLYRLQQSKLTHMNYMNEKMGRLLLRVADIGKTQRETGEETIEPLNRTYNLRKRLINKEQKEKIPSLKPLINLLMELETEFFNVNNYMQISAKEIDFLAKSLRISTLKMSHYMWRERLYMAALRNSAEGLENISNENICALGKWLEGPGREDFGSMPEFSRLNNLHVELHKVGGSVAALISQQLVDTDAIIRIFERLEIMSQGVVSELDKLDDWQIKAAELNSYKKKSKSGE